MSKDKPRDNHDHVTHLCLIIVFVFKSTCPCLGSNTNFNDPYSHDLEIKLDLGFQCSLFWPGSEGGEPVIDNVTSNSAKDDLLSLMKEVSSSVHDGKENIITPTEAPVGENVQSDISGKIHKITKTINSYLQSQQYYASHHTVLTTKSYPNRPYPIFLPDQTTLKPLKLNVKWKSRNCTRTIEAIIFIKGHDIAEKVYFCCKFRAVYIVN